MVQLENIVIYQENYSSYDTFGDVFAVIDSEEFSECFSKWVADLANLTEG